MASRAAATVPTIIIRGSSISLHNVGQCVGSHRVIHSLSGELAILSPIVSKYLIIQSSCSIDNQLSAGQSKLARYFPISLPEIREASFLWPQATVQRRVAQQRDRGCCDDLMSDVTMSSCDDEETGAGIGQSPHYKWWLDCNLCSGWAWLYTCLGLASI